MERRDIEIFLTLAAELHFGRTAEKLLVTTARVSQTIKKLERRIGVPLFDRTSRLVSLTPVGRQLRDDLLPAYEKIEAGVQRAIAAGREVSGLLRVGFGGTAPGHFVMDVADVFQAKYPACDVQIRENLFSDGPTSLLDGEIDVLLGTFPALSDELAFSRVLHREPALLAVSARHPLARRPTVTMADIARTTVLRPACPDVGKWDEAHLPGASLRAPHVTHGPVFATTQELLALVGAGKGVFPVPAHAGRFDVRPDVAYVPISDGPEFSWGFFWRQAGETSRISAFVQTAERLMAARKDWMRQAAA